ncbi:hypothetical protein QP794_21205 [Paenibacillus sp. UMB7766-LJ446]|uniref:hypothetical protein n=1 Tax=Paenibacillus sp. UMB7766-LJ446 TaxID=3046313 RepID=UPI002549DA4D|nr:hypothetical protein [Paenibacillus sp. UMB7766-LJ446]MDK8192609.1 hypothetical protein [Paenibacillus sp. UMB7766-LJ446]
MSRENKPIVTKHGLNLVARYQMEEVPALSKMIIVGTQAESVAAEDIQQQNLLPSDSNIALPTYRMNSIAEPSVQSGMKQAITLNVLY